MNGPLAPLAITLLVMAGTATLGAIIAWAILTHGERLAAWMARDLQANADDDEESG